MSEKNANDPEEVGSSLVPPNGDSAFGRKLLLQPDCRTSTPDPHRSWTKESIIEAIQALHRKGLISYVSKRDQGIYCAVKRHFGGWRTAVVAAGLESVGKQWSKRRVIEEIRTRHERGMALNSGIVCKQEAPRPVQALGCLATRGMAWGRRPTANVGHLHHHWENCMTREEIIRQIVSRDVQNQGLSKEATLRDAKKLYISACEHFGTWDTALKYAGVNVPHVATEAAYSQERVLRRIRKLCLNGCELSAHGNARRDRRLYIAARQYFGTWRQALRAAGINTANAFPRSKPRQLDRQKIVEQLRQRKEAGLPLTWSQVCLDNRALASAAKHAFHGWRRALAAADLAPTERLADGGPRWNKQRVIEAIKSRQREGKCLTCTGTGKDDGALVSAARRYFGNWTKALTAAGVLPRKRNKGSGVAK